MGKSRIFLGGLISFLVGVVLAKFIAMPVWLAGGAAMALVGLILLFDDRPVKIFSFWALMIIVGCAYPGILGREKLIAIDPNNPVLQWFSTVRSAFLVAIYQAFPEPTGVFAQGLTIGERSDLPSAIKRQFIDTGTIHIVAVSGYNFTIVTRLLYEWIRGIGRTRSFVVGTLAIIAFIIITGAQPSVIRAGVMGWLFLLAPFLGRLPNITIALFLTASVMVALQPSLLTDSLNFQLSFLAMLGLIWVEPPLKKYLDSTGWQRFVPKAFRDGLTATLAAQVMTLGLILAVFGRLSVVAPLVNMVIAPLVPAGMILAIVAGLAAVAWLPLGTIVAYPAWLVLTLILAIIEFFSRFQLSSLVLHPWPWWWAVGYYLIVLIVLWLTSWRVKHETKQALVTST